MKRYWLVLLGCFFALVAFVSLSNDSFEIPAEGITFHQVNLVCGAATDIGCGSRSKPILLDLQKETSIKEAWLNRAGTIVAVVWEKSIEPDVQIVPNTFKKHGKSIETLTGSDYQGQLNSFKNDRWYKGNEVDELSIEEAGRIANQIIEPLIEDGLLTKATASKMFSEVKQYIQHEFMILEDVNLLNTTTYYDNWEKEIEAIGAKYMVKMPKLEMCGPSGPTCKKGESTCCTSGTKCSGTSWFATLFN